MYKVIIADDEALILAGLQHKVDWAALGFEIVRACRDGRELLDAILESPPDLMLIDIQMPNLTGLDVMRRMYDSHPIPTILISGYSDFAYAQEALRYGAIDYLLKPFSSQMLQEAILKAKAELDSRLNSPRPTVDMMLSYFRMNQSRLSDEEMADYLSLSNTRACYWTAAFHGSCQLLHAGEDEIVLLPYDPETTLAIIHTDTPPTHYEAYLNEHFSFDRDAGIAQPFKHLTTLPERADAAYALLETRYLTRGIHLWSTEHESASIEHYLKCFWQAHRDKNYALLAQRLSRLPEYVNSHRLSIRSLEVLYNVIVNKAMELSLLRSVHYMTWKELLATYPSFDSLASDLYALFVPEGNGDDTALTSGEIIFRIKALVQNDYAQPISLQNYANRFHLDKCYLSSLFHKRVNETFTNYVTKIRIQHACEYLKTTDLSHGEIAHLCGFNTDSYMKQAFKKVIGITPLAYRQSAKAMK